MIVSKRVMGRPRDPDHASPFSGSLACAAPLAAVGHVLLIEPRWVQARRLNLAKGEPRARFVFFTELHHKGDRRFLNSVVRTSLGFFQTPTAPL